jgi:hypothetical protein
MALSVCALGDTVVIHWRLVSLCRPPKLPVIPCAESHVGVWRTFCSLSAIMKFSAVTAIVRKVGLVLGLTGLGWSTGCSADSADAAESREDDLTGLWECQPDRIIANAPPERRAILERAAKWVRNPVSYSLTDYQDGYRKDCSGFVSMAWGLGTSITTAQIPPRSSSTAYAEPTSWEELEPGDAVSRRGTSTVMGMTVGHIRLYAGTTSLGRMCFWEQEYLGLDALSGTAVHTYSQWRLQLEGYEPIRKN